MPGEPQHGEEGNWRAGITSDEPVTLVKIVKTVDVRATPSGIKMSASNAVMIARAAATIVATTNVVAKDALTFVVRTRKTKRAAGHEARRGLRNSPTRTAILQRGWHGLY